MSDDLDDRNPATDNTRRWERIFDCNLGKEPAPNTLIVTHGLNLPAGNYRLSVDSMGKVPSAYSLNEWEDGCPKWYCGLYVILITDKYVAPAPVPDVDLLPFGPEIFERIPMHTSAYRDPWGAQRAFNGLPEKVRSFAVIASSTVFIHVGFDYRDNKGKVKLIVERTD